MNWPWSAGNPDTVMVSLSSAPISAECSVTVDMTSTFPRPTLLSEASMNGLTQSPVRYSCARLLCSLRRNTHTQVPKPPVFGVR